MKQRYTSGANIKYDVAMVSSEEITVVVVDDDPNSVKLLSKMLKGIDHVQLVGVSCTYEDAVQKILDKKPRLLLLDIMMPHKSGFDIVREIRKYELNPKIVFVTAHDRFAIEAFHEAAFDYLLKPITQNSLKRIIERFKHENSKEDLNGKINNLLKAFQSKKIHFNTRTGFIMINPLDIVFIKASGNYSEIYCRPPDKLVVTYYLSDVEKKLPKERFFRVSRSVIINLQYLQEVNRKEKYCEINWQDQLFRFHMPLSYIRALEAII